MVTFENSDQRYLLEEAIKTAINMADITIAALRNRIDDIRELSASHIDGTTGLLNKDTTHRLLDHIVLGLEHGHRRTDTLNSLLVVELDIEKFKQYNETSGQMAGDKVLAASGSFLRHEARYEEGDIVGRIGGDELLWVIRFDSSLVSKEGVLNSVERRIKDRDPERFPDLPTFRWNHAFYQPGDTCESILKRADVKASEEEPDIQSRVRRHSQTEEEYQAALARAKIVTLSAA